MKNNTGILRQSLLKKFGLEDTGTYRSTLQQTYINDIKKAIERRNQVAVVGQFGAGKTELVNQIKQSWQAKRPLFIDIVSPDKTRLTITSAVDKMLRRLQVKHHGRSTEAKATNLIDALGRHMRDNNRPVCLVIDNAHRCREELFSDLRDLREQDFNGIKPLLSVLLIGQEGLEGKLYEHPEVGWRTQFLSLSENTGWWTFAERVNYLQQVYGKAITSGARENIAVSCSGPLEMDYRVGEAMKLAAGSGVKDVIDEEVVPASLQKMKSDANVSYQAIADQSGMPKSQVENAIKNEDQEDQDERVQKTLQKMLQNQQSKSKTA